MGEQYPQYGGNISRKGYGGYLNMQGQDEGQYPQPVNNYYLSQTNFPGSSRQFAVPQGPPPPQQNYYPIQQQPQPYNNRPNSSLIGFQAVKLIRKIWGTPCTAKKSGGQLLQCRQTCGGKAICKPVSCVVTKCPRPKKCAQPIQTCRIQPQSPMPCYPRPKVKCQYRVVSQPRRMMMMRSPDQNMCQSQECPMTLVMDANRQQSRPMCVGQPVTQCQLESGRQYADMSVGCSTAERYMSAARRESSRFNFGYDDFMEDGPRCGPSRGPPGGYWNNFDEPFGCRARSCENYGGRDRCGPPGSGCDSCESFDRWREKCECRKKEKEACEAKVRETCDGHNDPKPTDQATSSDEKLKDGKSVSVNTSKTKTSKSKRKLKKSKSDGSLKSKGKKGKKGGKNKKGSKGKKAGGKKGKKKK